ncbi:hypothetical protein UCRPC4_g03531 [Phaeomoniella chlamydospora]|uniref:Amidohydrolase-related domain-containing protein n=1 Tax=Phaeomoniella chlamydospora TaxID=158046 RepID=A0A0G2GY61_PHACM|nr:hypothetical protein UCRPC4_g03531 [Phaeomoniella chlamydospora]
MHLETDDDLRALCQSGITTGLDMACWPHDKVKSLRNRSGMADIRSPGLPATCPGSMHSAILPLPSEHLVTNAEDAIRFVHDRLNEEADYIKVIADVSGPDQATLNTLVSEAHRYHKLVIAHAAYTTAFHMALDAKADIITHSPLDETLDESTISRMLTENHIAVPTLVMMEAMSKPISLFTIVKTLFFRPLLVLGVLRVLRANPSMPTGRNYTAARDSVTAMYKAGVPILVGTDANSEPDSPAPVRHGESFHRELELLVEAGMSTVDVLRGATVLAARYFGLKDRGTIEVGKRADLVLLSQNPLEDIRASKSILRVWCAGVEVVG